MLHFTVTPFKIYCGWLTPPIASDTTSLVTFKNVYKIWPTTKMCCLCARPNLVTKLKSFMITPQNWKKKHLWLHSVVDWSTCLLLVRLCPLEEMSLSDGLMHFDRPPFFTLLTIFVKSHVTGITSNFAQLLFLAPTHFQIIRIAETKQNFIDLGDLEEQLKLHQFTGRQLIGCFSAASSVTGIQVDDVASTLLLHEYGAFAFWDYNLVAPYVAINMNSKVPGIGEDVKVAKDAIYFSGHKFIGGVQTPGRKKKSFNYL